MAENTENNDRFTFEMSLNILNHLGRNLYRSFVTVLGEAISNSWDADAKNVNIYIGREKNSFIIKDDGIGMSRNDFQNKFLKIGYSKRKDGQVVSPGGRPYIGRKGIGKLALLSCSDKVSMISKIVGGEYVGGVIDNSGLDDAIQSDMKPDEYQLDNVDFNVFSEYLSGHEKGTIIYFENLKEGINKGSDYLKKLIALYFRFSLIDDSFNIFLDDEEITTANLKDLAEKTQFLWKINDYNDPYIQNQLNNIKEEKTITLAEDITGFIASVVKPRDLKVISTEERVSIDLFTNGRLREKDILKYMPSARIVENYLYGQIHYNALDDERDRFSSSREGVVADDPKFGGLIEKMKKVLEEIIEDWDKWRVDLREPGDPDNERILERDRKSLELYNTVSESYVLDPDSTNKERIDGWIGGLANDATFNFGSYAECFISENLIRKYIDEENVQLSTEAERDIQDLRRREEQHKRTGNCNIDLRQSDSDISYLDMNGLAYLVDRQRGPQNCLPTDAKEYKPIRDALMHTALLTEEAKRKLTAIYDNIKGRVKTLLSRSNN